MSGKTVRIDEDVAVRCPCGKTVAFGHDELGTPVALHELPACQKYHELGLVEYLVYVRKSGES